MGIMAYDTVTYDQALPVLPYHSTTITVKLTPTNSVSPSYLCNVSLCQTLSKCLLLYFFPPAWNQAVSLTQPEAKWDHGVVSHVQQYGLLVQRAGDEALPRHTWLQWLRHQDQNQVCWRRETHSACRLRLNYIVLYWLVFTSESRMIGILGCFTTTSCPFSSACFVVKKPQNKEELDIFLEKTNLSQKNLIYQSHYWLCICLCLWFVFFNFLCLL